MVKPTIFEFTAYTADLGAGQLSFHYAIHFENAEPIVFTERLVLPQGIDADVPPQLLENILSGLHLILGISYYKLYVPKKFQLPYKLSKQQAEFWNTVYRKGLGEFLYRNNLDPKELAEFQATGAEKVTATYLKRQNRVLSSIGGGKDSIVSTELLKEGKFKVTTLYTQTQKPNEQVGALLKAFKLPNLTIERYLDEKIFAKHPDSYNGHIPVSAILAFIGTLIGILYDYRYVVVANERSSNFGNIEYHGEEINHQWSKSAQFEGMFQDYARRYITPDVTYFSLMRHSNEIRIAKLFSKYPQYFKLFSSCNRVSVILSPAKNLSRSFGKPQDDKWCGECAKCAFAFTMLSPFISKKELLAIFGKDLRVDKKLGQIFKDISGRGGMKPFDCVGTFEEVRVALNLNHSHILKNMRIKKEDVTAALQTYPAPLIPPQFAFLGMEKALILGYGTEGKITQQYLKKHYPKLKIGIADRSQGKQYLSTQADYDIAIRTPGIQKELVNIFYTTATNIFLSQTDNLVIGVTGSKGKSTTASLIHAIIKESKRPTLLLGNIGEPMLAALTKIKKNTILVIELSSYQLDDIQTSPHIAVITNLFPDHMNYHGSLQTYYNAKKNIIRYQRKGDYLVFNPKPAELAPWVKESVATPVPYQPDLPIKDSEIPLLGTHNRDNVRAAVTVARLLNIPDEVSAKAIKKFKGLPHRLQFIGELRNIRFYNDALATTPEATIEALRALPETQTIFLGGEDRGYDFSKLEELIHSSKIKNVAMFPDSGKKMLKNTKGLRILHTKSLEAAVQFAYRHTTAGSICLLSMASPSYSLWKNFAEKGNEFQKFVKYFGKTK